MYHYNNVIVIDLGIIKKIETYNTIFIPNKDYYIWPDRPCYIYAVPLYSIGINALELFNTKIVIANTITKTPIKCPCSITSYLTE